MVPKLILGVLAGGAVGAVIGYIGKCSSGACPLTGHPVTAGIFGAIIGALLTLSAGGCSRSEPEYHSPNVLRVTSAQEFDAEVLGEKDKPVLVDFYADWCGPCRALSPTIEKLADEVKDWAVVAKVNVDRLPDLAKRYQVSSIPNLKVFRGGKLVADASDSRNGPELKTALEKAKSTSAP